MKMESRSYNIELAIKYGRDEATFINCLSFWLRVNESKHHNYKDGRYWVFNTYEEWLEQLPEFSRDELKRVLKSLRDNGVIDTGRFNSNPYDRTLWYTFSAKFEKLTDRAILPDGQGEVTLTNGRFRPMKRAVSPYEAGETAPSLTVLNTVDNTIGNTEREDAHTCAGNSLSHKNGSVATAEIPQSNPVDVWAYEIRNEFPRKGGEFADIDAIKKARTRLMQKGMHSFDAQETIGVAVLAYRDYLKYDCLFSESPWNCTTFFEKGYFLDKAAWSKAMESNNRKPEPQQGSDELKQMGVDW